MIIFAITREGYFQVEPLVKSASYILWVGEGVLTQEEIKNLRERDIDVTDIS